jgi:hypothetical protein
MVRQHAFLMPVLFIAQVCLTTTGQTPLAHSRGSRRDGDFPHGSLNAHPLSR